MAVDPLTFLPALARANVDLFAGRFEAAVEQILRAREKFAPGEPFSGWWAAQTLAYAGREEEAHEIYQQVAAMDAGIWSAHCALFQRALEDDRDGVLKVLAESTLHQSAKTDEYYPVHIANSLARVGEIDEALIWVEHAINWGFTNYQFLSQHNRFLAPLRGNERFQHLMELAREKQEAFEA